MRAVLGFVFGFGLGLGVGELALAAGRLGVLMTVMNSEAFGDFFSWGLKYGYGLHGFSCFAG